MIAPDIDSILDKVHDYIRRSIAAGFQTPDAILDTAVEIYEEDADPFILRYTARRMVDEAVAAHLVEQAAWPQVTDCERLDAAFADLEEAGILCRQDYSCCGTCGSAELWDEMQQQHEAGRNVRGGVYFHNQDTASAVEGDGLFLAYGSMEDEGVTACAIARDVIAALEEHGLATEWNGQWSRRIYVHLQWQRRRALDSVE